MTIISEPINESYFKDRLNQKDLEPYVYALHHIDDLSAKFGKTAVADL